jgi:hypothetical protein
MPGNYGKSIIKDTFTAKASTMNVYVITYMLAAMKVYKYLI